jgi:hypothetical protein
MARTSAAVMLVPAPLDRVPRKKVVAAFARESDLTAKAQAVRLTGTLSPRARQEFQSAFSSVREAPPVG